MQEFDFLFIYEHKVRELENVCLMKYELDKRGYSTKIVYIEDAQNAIEPRPIYHTKVLCTMACYDNHTLYWHVKEYVTFDKVIDLQWENIVYTKDEDRVDAYKNYRGIGKNVVHVSWGQQNVNRLINAAHVDSKLVKLTGHVGMDFLRYPLSRYYYSKEDFFEKYQLPLDKKVILFASPYYGDNLSESYISDMCYRFGDDWVDYYDFMLKSQKVVLDWFEKICKEHEDIVFIFRPHPGHPSLASLELEKRLSNFRVIKDDSVKQWILVCDKIYTGNSSVVVEAFFAKKDCQLLFPFPITPGFELQMISDSSKITTFDEFEKSVLCEKESFPTPVEDIEDIYLVDWDKYNYQKFADMAEEVLADDAYRLSKKQLRKFREYSLSDKIVRFFSNRKLLYNVYLKILENESIQPSFIVNQRRIRNSNIETLKNFEKDHSFELTNDEEISSIISRITNALEEEK